MNDSIIFYTHPQSRGRMVRWMLEECSAQYQTTLLEYGSTMKAADYLAINPMGKVPAIRYGEQIVTETAAICTFLAEVFPAAKLAPPPADRGAYYRWLFVASGPLEQAITHKALGVELNDKQRVFVGGAGVEEMAAMLDAHLSEREFIASDSFSAADLYVGSQIGFGLQFGTLPKLPAMEAYWNRLKQRPARLRADAMDDALMKT